MSLFGGDQELNLTIKARDEASAVIDKVQKSNTSLTASIFKGVVASQAFSEGLRFLSGFLKGSVEQYDQLNQAVGQTNAVLASTGHAAGMTATEVVNLSKSLSQNTLYQDDMVLSAENMLLTFTNITKTIFPQATQVTLDMSTALGQDLKSSAIQLGKALNDPIQGITALQRVGVSFSNAQKEVITALVKSGDTMQAQRLILAELTKEFGGSAQSAYESASSVQKLQKNYVDLQQDIGSGLVPAMNNLFSAFQDNNSAMGKTADIGKVAFQTFAKISEGAIAAYVSIRSVATGLVAVTSSFAQTTLNVTGVSTAMKLFGKDSNAAFDNFRAGLKDDEKTTLSLYDTLKDKNDAVLNSWGEVTEAAHTFGKVGPAAYVATAAEASAANKKIQATKQFIAETSKSFDDLKKKLDGDNTDAARAFADQEQKIFDLRKQATDETDPEKKKDLMTQIGKEQAALDAARPQFRGDQSTVLAEAERRSIETDFERSLEDIKARKIDDIQTSLQQISFTLNFNDAVVGNDGLTKVKEAVMDALNRAAKLKVAGT
jgi:hypothetical protein